MVSPARPGSTEPISSPSNASTPPESGGTGVASIGTAESAFTNQPEPSSPGENVYPAGADGHIVTASELQEVVDDELPVTALVPKELSPVSPVPLHIPEPSKIPLLLDPALSRTIPNEDQIPPDIGSALSDPSLSGSLSRIDIDAFGEDGNHQEASIDPAQFVVEPFPIVANEILLPSSQSNLRPQDEIASTGILANTDLSNSLNEVAEHGKPVEILPTVHDVPYDLNQQLPSATQQSTSLHALLANFSSQTHTNLVEAALDNQNASHGPAASETVLSSGLGLPSPSTTLPTPPNFKSQSTSVPISAPAATLRHPLPENPTTTTQDDPESDIPFTPEEEKAYESFLDVERDYVAKGEWSRFPVGSRLFIGNLSSERVSKRDIFRIFSRYGDLAQISIKQAFGFVQFFDTGSCTKALRDEQGTAVRGRKMHLEISKPQRNTRNEEKASNIGGRGDRVRRSRSPEEPISPRNRNYRGAPVGDRDRDRDRDRERDREARLSRDNGVPRGRDEYRPNGRRMSSPRSQLPRDRDDYYGRDYRDRSRSPQRGRFRSPSPARGQGDGYRTSAQPTDALFVVFDDLDPAYIKFIEKPFLERRLRTNLLYMNPRVNLESCIKRHVVEGCRAVVFLTRATQNAGKLSTQIFKGDGGDPGRYDEYDMVDPNIAAELVSRACSNQQQPAYNNHQGSYHTSPYQPQPIGAQPNQAGYLNSSATPQNPLNMTTGTTQQNLASILQTIDPSTLQTLLAQLQGQGQPGQPQAPIMLPQTPYHQITQQLPKHADLSAILGAATRGQAPAQSYNHVSHGIPGYQNNPALANLLGHSNILNATAGTSQQPPPNPQVQDIMSQLTGHWGAR